MKDFRLKRVDLRSDTVTKPCQDMRRAMASAKVGDDVNGDDPTVLLLQQKVAKLLGKEAGLFLPSGTMSNAVAVRTHTQPGDEIITEEQSHLYLYEGGGYAALSGCSVALVPGKRGIMCPEDVERRIRRAEGSRGHYPNGRLVCLENTSNRGGGTCYPRYIVDAISQIAHSKDCRLHLDGARLFNAAIATKEKPARMVRDCDSISVCLSKGLGAPVGSVLVGTKSFIEQAHRWRKMLGGGMRQSGILAAGGIFALESNLNRLEEDHRRARLMGESLAGIGGLSIELDSIETNMVYVETVKPASSWVEALFGKGIDCFPLGEKHLRLVTHLHLEDQDIARAVKVFEEISIQMNQ